MVPNLNVAGWWDQEDVYGPMKIYELMEKNDPDHMNYLVAGRGITAGGRDRTAKLGDVEFGGDTSIYFRQNIEAPWFAYWLKNKGSCRWKRR